MKKLLVIIMSCLLLTSCARYYKEPRPLTEAEIQEMKTTMNNRTGRMCDLIKQMNHEEYLEYSGKMLAEREIYLDKFEQKLKRRAVWNKIKNTIKGR